MYKFIHRSMHEGNDRDVQDMVGCGVCSNIIPESTE